MAITLEENIVSSRFETTVLSKYALSQ